MKSCTFFLSIIVIVFQSCSIFKKGQSNKNVQGFDTFAVRQLYYSGENEFQLQKWTEAKSAFEKCLKYGYQPYAVQFRLASIEQKLGNKVAALKYYQSSYDLSNEKNRHEIAVRLAECFEQNKKYKEAAEIFAEQAKKNPTFYSLHKRAAENYLYAKEFSETIKFCESIWEKHFTLLEDIAKIKIRAYKAANQFQEVIQVWEALIKKYPDRKNYVKEYADYLLQLGYKAEAEKLLQAHFNEADKNSWVGICDVFAKNGNIEKWKSVAIKLAEEKTIPFSQKEKCLSYAFYDNPLIIVDESTLNAILSALVQTHPEIGEDNLFAARWYYKKEKNKESFSQFQQAFGKSKYNLEDYNKHLKLAKQIGTTDDQFSVAESMLTQYPTNVATCIEFATVALFNKNYSLVIEKCEQTLLYSADAEEQTKLKIFIAEAQSGLGRLQLALDMYNGLLSSQPNNAELLEKTGDLYLKMGNKSMAKTNFQSAINAGGDKTRLENKINGIAK